MLQQTLNSNGTNLQYGSATLGSGESADSPIDSTVPSGPTKSKEDRLPGPVSSQPTERTKLERSNSPAIDWTLLATVSALIFATLWGVLARLGLTWIGGFSDSVVFPLIWAQIVGCLIMGANIERKADVERM